MCVAVLAALGAVTAPVRAQETPRAMADAPAMRLRGEGRLTWLGLTIYDARLHTGASFNASSYARQPFMLELIYRRELRSADIARRSVVEMRRQRSITDAQASAWEQALRGLIPDVRAGDRVTGVNHPGIGAAFEVNGRAVGEIADPDFARLFFGIWLAGTTSEPALRAALLGEALP